MSKRKIVVTIDCNAKTCGICEWFHHNSGPAGYCLHYGYLDEFALRPPECIAAEVKK